jgi:hypothetical protein
VSMSVVRNAAAVYAKGDAMNVIIYLLNMG